MEVTFLENSRIIPSVNIMIYGNCNRYKVSYLARFCFLFEFWLLLLRSSRKIRTKEEKKESLYCYFVLVELPNPLHFLILNVLLL